MSELIRRIAELFSLGSCMLNVLIGTGDREITLSAGSFELLRRGTARGPAFVSFIDWLNRPLNGPGHCERAWLEHEPIWVKVKADEKASAIAS